MKSQYSNGRTRSTVTKKDSIEKKDKKLWRAMIFHVLKRHAI